MEHLTTRTPFSHSLFPPAPALEIRLHSPFARQKSMPLLAVIDTGSDTTIIPTQLLRQLNLQPLRRERVRGLWGGQRVVHVYIVNVEINDVQFREIEVVATDDESTVLIGRDIVNHLQIFIDGPNKTVEIVN